MAGVVITGVEVNNQAGVVARSVFTALDTVTKFQAWLASMPDATLTAAPYNMAQADVTIIKSSFTDLNKLAGIFAGTQTQAVVNDFRTFSKQLIGPTY